MPVTAQELYQRMVIGSKGSYCFGQNGLLLGILRGLGYRCAASSAVRLLTDQGAGPTAALVESWYQQGLRRNNNQ